MKYGFRIVSASLLFPAWIRPREAVALNLFQFLAWATQDRLSFRNESLVVYAFWKAFDQTAAPCRIEDFGPIYFLIPLMI